MCPNQISDAEKSNAPDLPKVAKVAKFLSQSSNGAAAVFRRYDSVALEIILHRRRKLDELLAAEKGRKRSSEMSSNSSVHGGDSSCLGQVAPSDKIKDALHEYYEAIDVYSRILRFDRPASRTVRGIQKFLNDQNISEYKVAENERPYADLICLRCPLEDDWVSRIVANWFPIFFLAPESTIDTQYLDERRIRRFSTFIGTLIAIAFLVGALWALRSEETDMARKLCTVTGLVVAFACWMGFCTSAQRKEVLTATAAYAAVLMVYVGKAG